MEKIIKLTRDIEYFTIKAAKAKGIVDKEYYENMTGIVRFKLTREIRKYEAK